MKIVNPDTGTEYDSMDALVGAEANGWSVVVHLRGMSRSRPRFARVIGPFGTSAEARAAALRIRRQFKAVGDRTEAELERTTVEPIWPSIDFFQIQNPNRQEK